MLSRIVLAMCAALLAVGLPAPAQAAPTQPAHRYEVQAFNHTNVARANHGLGPLRRQECLQRQADRWAKHMAVTGSFTHQSMGALATRCGLGYVGENIAAGYATGADAVRGWLASPGHRKNIMSPHYTHSAVGVYRLASSPYKVYVSQVFGSR